MVVAATSTGLPWTPLSSPTIRLSFCSRSRERLARTFREDRRRRSVRPVHAPSTSPDKVVPRLSSSPTFRCGDLSFSRMRPLAWSRAAARVGPSGFLSCGQGLQSTPPAPGTRRVNPTAGSSPAGTAERASAPDPPAVSYRTAASEAERSSIFALGAELEDRERIGEIVAEHVSGRGDRVESRTDTRQRLHIASTGARMLMSSPDVS